MLRRVPEFCVGDIVALRGLHRLSWGVECVKAAHQNQDSHEAVKAVVALTDLHACIYDVLCNLEYTFTTENIEGKLDCPLDIGTYTTLCSIAMEPLPQKVPPHLEYTLEVIQNNIESVRRALFEAPLKDCNETGKQELLN